MRKPRLSIHTATYNRGYIIEQAYRSLQAQTCHDFEWVVTDDGSTDNTPELFEKWCREETRFPIIYNWKERGGIPRALNFGLSKVNGDYFFMLDSDDYLYPDAVEKIYKWIAEIDDKPNFVGVGFVINTQDGVPIKGVPPIVNEEGYVDCTNLERWKYNLDADMREAYKVEILKRYPFQVWETEVFAPEQLCMDAMALDGYKLRWTKEAIYVCKYLPDGMTRGHWDLLRKNPMGYAMLSNQALLYRKGLERLKAAAQHIALSIVGKSPGYILKSNCKWLTMLALPYGIALSFRRRNQFKWDDPIKRINYSTSKEG